MIYGLISSFLLGYLPMLLFAGMMYWLDCFEKEPLKLLIFVFLWGSVFASSIAFLVNTILGVGIFWLSNSEMLTNFSIASIIAPVIEELTKGCAVLAVFLFARREFDSWMDGIVYGAIVGLGFAATENFYYIFSMGFQAEGLFGMIRMALIRIVLVGWQHPFYTAFTGLGFAISRTTKTQALKIFAPLFGVCVAIFVHSFHNTLSPIMIQREGVIGMLHASLIDWIGWASIAILILFLIQREGKRIRHYLLQEVSMGTLFKNQYKYTFSKPLQWKLIGDIRKTAPGEIKNFRLFFQLCAEITHKKRQLELFGNEDRNVELILTTRNSISKLSQRILPYFPDE